MFSKELRNSIRFKFPIVLSLIIFISAVVMSAMIALNERARFEYSLRTKGLSFASYIAKLSLDPLVMRDVLQLDSLVNEANKDEEIAYTLIHDAQGNLITSQYASINYLLERLRTTLSQVPKDSDVPEIIAAIKQQEPIIEIAVPIRTGNDAIGIVTVGLMEYKIHRQIAETILYIIAVNLLVAIALGAMLFGASKMIILTPIIELSRAASRLATGDLSTRVNVKSTGEIQMLVDSFNAMAGDLEKTTVSRNYMDDIIRSMRDALLVMSPEGTITRVNMAACFLLGYDETELRGMPFDRVIMNEPGEDGQTLAIVLQNSSVNAAERIFSAKNGKKVPVLFSASVMRTPGGDVHGVVCVARDITDRKRSEETLKAYSLDLQEVNEELKSFAYIVSHDLRAPLVNIRGFSEELVHGIRELEPLWEGHRDGYSEKEREKFRAVLKKDIPEALKFIGASVSRMDNLINAILNLSRAGRRKLNPEPLRTHDIVRGILDTLAHQMESRAVTVTMGELADLIADRTAVEQIFGNLLDNAVKYLDPARPGIIEIWADRDDREIVFHVRDNGRGMSGEDIPKAFEIFRRVGRQDIPGEGMGLAYVRALVRNLGGRIWCASQLGVGTTFSFSLPAAAGELVGHARAGGRS